MTRPLRLLVLAALCAVGCEPDFDPASKVEKLRVLAVRAEPASVQPGGVVTLSTLVADPLGGGRKLSFAWEACFDSEAQEIPLLLPTACARAEDLLLLGGGPTLEYTVPEKVGEIEELRLFIDESGTFNVPVRLRVSAGNDEALAIASVAVQLEGSANSNPQLTDLRIGSAPWPADEPLTVGLMQEVQLSATWTVDSTEPYTLVTEGTAETLERVEVMRVSWFASVGELDADTSSASEPEVELRVEAPPKEGSILRLWAILSDGRGGYDWAIRDIEIE